MQQTFPFKIPDTSPAITKVAIDVPMATRDRDKFVAKFVFAPYAAGQLVLVGWFNRENIDATRTFVLTEPGGDWDFVLNSGTSAEFDVPPGTRSVTFQSNLTGIGSVILEKQDHPK